MPRHRRAPAALAAGVLALAACTGAPAVVPPRPDPRPSLSGQTSGTTALLQAVSAVDERTVWVSGHQGMFARTLDGGATWHAARGPGADTLQFRDVHAVSADTAYLLSAGSGELSRIYKTTDGGRSWALQFINRDPKAFFDCFDFWDADHGAAFSDEVDGRVTIVTTSDGGAHWTHVPAERLPAALPGEGGFAASGTCLVAGSGGRGWIGTGNGPAARALLTADRGQSWTAVLTPIASGEAAGITSVAFRDSLHGVVLGGNIGKPAMTSDNVAITTDGGRSWTLGGRPGLTGAVYGAAYVRDAPRPVLVAVGPGGASYTLDDGRSWLPLDSASYWSVGFASPRAGWAVGPGGRITRIAMY